MRALFGPNPFRLKSVYEIRQYFRGFAVAAIISQKSSCRRRVKELRRLARHHLAPDRRLPLGQVSRWLRPLLEPAINNSYRLRRGRLAPALDHAVRSERKNAGTGSPAFTRSPTATTASL